MGCILYELAVRKKLFRDDLAVQRHSILSKERLNIEVPNVFGDLPASQIGECIHSMLQLEPELRPSASELVENFSQRNSPIAGSAKTFKEFNQLSRSDSVNGRRDESLLPRGITF